MNMMEWNKIFGGVLTALLVVMLSGFFSDIVFHEKELVEPAYKVAIPETGEEKSDEPVEIVTGTMLLASMDIDGLTKDGSKVAKKCVACHSFENGGASKVGPNLWNVVNASIAHIDDFSYSETLANMKAEGEIWNYEHLDAFLENPKGWAPGTKMGFAGLRKPEDRAAIIAYLRSMSDAPAELPAPSN